MKITLQSVTCIELWAGRRLLLGHSSQAQQRGVISEGGDGVYIATAVTSSSESIQFWNCMLQ